jgi:hypothetical protein
MGSRDPKGDMEFAKKIEAMGFAMLELDRQLRSWRNMSATITEIRIKGATENNPNVLVVVKAKRDGKRVVGFHSHLEPAEALRGALARVQSDSLSYKEDKYTDKPTPP